jgi:hypothetical protein
MPRRRVHVLKVAAAAVVGVAACYTSKPIELPPGTELASGTWGGPNAGVIVNDTIAHVHIGCTYGDVNGRVPLSSNGAFTRTGSFLLRAYPVAVGPTMPALFEGRVDGNTLTLTVTVTDTVQHKNTLLGPVSVVYGKDPQLGPCPICALPGRRVVP